MRTDPPFAMRTTKELKEKNGKSCHYREMSKAIGVKKNPVRVTSESPLGNESGLGQE